jgi:hypothetical protein
MDVQECLAGYDLPQGSVGHERISQQAVGAALPSCDQRSGNAESARGVDDAAVDLIRQPFCLIAVDIDGEVADIGIVDRAEFDPVAVVDAQNALVRVDHPNRDSMEQLRVSADYLG